MSHSFTTGHRRSVTSQARGRARIIPFGILDAKMFATCMVFSWYLPFPSPHPYTNVAHLHSAHRPQHIISQFYKSLTKTSVCGSLKNINKEPSQQVGVLCTESYGLLSEFEQLYVVTWSEKKLVHNCNCLNCHTNCPSSSR